MIINTGSRTDIPAFFSSWFYNRIREGYVLVRNPYYPEQILRYRLDPDVVDCLCFCTKNPEPMLERIGELDEFRQLWYVTITPYGQDIEPYVPHCRDVIRSLQKLSQAVGKEKVIWRYDPVFITEKYDLKFHLKMFREMAEMLSGFTTRCVISFIDLYEKTRRNFPQAGRVQEKERLEIGASFAETGEKTGIRIMTCCEGSELELYGVDCGGCMTQEVIEKAIGVNLQVPARSRNIREGCSCLLGADIGAYNTCSHGCLYCYANYDRESVEYNRKQHDSESPLLIGHLNPGEVVKEARQESYIDYQLRLF